MKKALVEESGRVAQIIAAGEEFPVAPGLAWIDAPDDVTTRHRREGGAFVLPPPPAAPAPVPAADIVDARLARDPAYAALVRVLAAEVGKTEAQIIAAIKTAAAV